MGRHCIINTKTPFTSCVHAHSKVTTDITVNLQNKTYYHCSIIVTTYACIHAKIKNTIMKQRRQIGGSSLVVKKKSRERRKCRVHSRGVHLVVMKQKKENVVVVVGLLYDLHALYVFVHSPTRSFFKNHRTRKRNPFVMLSIF